MIQIVAKTSPMQETKKRNAPTPQPTSLISKMLYWNLEKKDLSAAILELTTLMSFDIVIFSETTQKTRVALNSVLSPLGFKSRTNLSGNPRVALFDKYQDSNVIYFKEDLRYTSIIYNIYGEKFMVVGVHLDSPASYPNVEDRYVLGRDEHSKIETNEKNYSVCKTVIIGDFNMNPFDKGMISELSFKATHCKQTAITSRSDKPYFFNPSWRIFSNDLTVKRGKKAPGTIHYVPNGKDTYVDYWHVFDQVLIRPHLFSVYTDSYEVLTGWKKVNLLNSSLVPDRTNFSDHLPITYTVEIRK